MGFEFIFFFNSICWSERDWSQDDKAREKQLMEDLVTVIEQRNQIINSLDQDRQREQEEDMLLEDMRKRRDFQRPSGHDQKIFSGKFKPMKILKQLSHKTESKKGKTKTPLKKKNWRLTTGGSPVIAVKCVTVITKESVLQIKCIFKIKNNIFHNKISFLTRFYIHDPVS